VDSRRRIRKERPRVTQSGIILVVSRQADEKEIIESCYGR
jgi:hypothetical protein